MERIVRLLFCLTVLSVLTVGLFPPETAEAKSVKCDFDGTCKVYCTQNLANGSIVEYEEGTEITVVTTDGQEVKFKCVNGDWVKQNSISLPGWDHIRLIGTISPATIGGLMGEMSTVVCNDSPEPVCTTVEHTLAPPRGTVQ